MDELAHIHSSKKCLGFDQHPVPAGFFSVQCVDFPELKRKMDQVTAFFCRAVLQDMVAIKDKFKIPMRLGQEKSLVSRWNTVRAPELKEDVGRKETIYVCVSCMYVCRCLLQLLSSLSFEAVFFTELQLGIQMPLSSVSEPPGSPQVTTPNFLHEC